MHLTIVSKYVLQEFWEKQKDLVAFHFISFFLRFY